MTTIKYYRFIPTLQIVKLKKDHQEHNVFITIYDHVEGSLESSDQAKAIVKRWLQDHYGYCVIHEEVTNKNIKICNHKKFIKDMHNLNLEVVVKQK